MERKRDEKQGQGVRGMKVGMLIAKLKKLKEKHGNLDIVIDYDENGWYSSEKVEVLDHYDDEDFECEFINIKSSNES